MDDLNPPPVGHWVQFNLSFLFSLTPCLARTHTHTHTYIQYTNQHTHYHLAWQFDQVADGNHFSQMLGLGLFLLREDLT